MKTMTLGFVDKNNHLYKLASVLMLITIFYTIGEGLASVIFGIEDNSMSLFGFGLDSFVEIVSGIGIWHMVDRIRRNGGENPDRFEKTALRITGTAFLFWPEDWRPPRSSTFSAAIDRRIPLGAS